MSLYSDKHTIFRSSKEGNLTQFGQMMADLGIEMIFANTPQAKGRIERYNGTVQRRLPNDIISFGIHDYDTLNRWFTAFYLPYIRRKFAFLPKDPHDSFVPLDGYDIDSIFTLRYERRIKNDSFSINGIYYSLIDENGEIMHIINMIHRSVSVLMCSRIKCTLFAIGKSILLRWSEIEEKDHQVSRTIRKTCMKY